MNLGGPSAAGLADGPGTVFFNAPVPSGCTLTRFFPQRQATFFSAFAVNQNAGLRLQHHIFDPESYQFRDPQSTRKAKMKHRSVTDAVPDSWVRGIQDRLHLLSSEVPDKPGVRLFRREIGRAHV